MRIQLKPKGMTNDQLRNMILRDVAKIKKEVGIICSDPQYGVK
jgi:hypothetical protein